MKLWHNWSLVMSAASLLIFLYHFCMFEIFQNKELKYMLRERLYLFLTVMVKFSAGSQV